jgi:type IV pilus assembly protein PilN
MINLLPWRAELRQKRKKEFLTATFGAVLMGAALTFGAKVYFQAQIDNQEARNQMLRDEITELDQRIAQIRELEVQKARLIARMEIIEELQTSRPESVHLMDEIVEIMPEGTRLTGLAQDNTRIEISGITEASTRVSALMNAIEESPWLRNPVLGVIETDNREGVFTVRANQIRMTDEAEGQG